MLQTNFGHPENLKKKIFFSNSDFSKYRYSVDYNSDLLIVKFIINKLKKLKRFGSTKDIVNIIKKDDKIIKLMNKNINKQFARRKKIFS